MFVADSEARRAVVEVAQELDRPRRMEQMPRPLNQWLDDWMQVLIRAEVAPLSRCDALAGLFVGANAQVSLKGTDLMDKKIKEHVFGDIIRRKVTMELRYRF